jgi:protein-disulfide isomerase
MKPVLALLLLSSVASAQPHGNPCGGKPMPTRPQLDAAKTYAIVVDPMDATDGSADAKVTMVDTYDYACPYCDKARVTMDYLKAKYGKDLRIVYKPFVVHMNNAMPYALAACAANKQHKFAELDAVLWGNYYKGRKYDLGRCWETKDGCANSDAAAKTAGLDPVAFSVDLKACEAYVKHSMGDMQAFFVDAIPTFFINGRVLTGAQPQESFENLIDEELGKATTRIKGGAKPASYYQTWIVGKGEKAPRPAPANPCGPM